MQPRQLSPPYRSINPQDCYLWSLTNFFCGSEREREIQRGGGWKLQQQQRNDGKRGAFFILFYSPLYSSFYPLVMPPPPSLVCVCVCCRVRERKKKNDIETDSQILETQITHCLYARISWNKYSFRKRQKQSQSQTQSNKKEVVVDFWENQVSALLIQN